MNDKIEFIKNVFESHNIQLTIEMCEKLLKYYENLINFNKITNITAITEFKEVVYKHFLDSCFANLVIPNNVSIIDVGSGAGIPSIPMAIVNNSYKITMIDSVNKKVEFIKQQILELNLTNCCVLHERSEDLAHNLQYRANFDYCIARAVAPLNVLSELCVPFVKNNGYFIAFKGSNYENELDLSKNALKILNSTVVETYEFVLGEYGNRYLLKIKKNYDISNIYPRKNNKPRLNPII